MTINEIEIFEKFLEDSFKDIIEIRELRLSIEEIKHLKKLYPKASVNQIHEDDFSDGKVWMEVRFSNAI